MKFILMVEGFTERDAAAEFIRRWLNPRLSRRVGIKVERFNGCDQFWTKAPKHAQMHLDGNGQADIVAVIGLLDLYGPAFYPPDKDTAEERILWGTAEMERRVKREKFRMFFAVHEFEAWILSSPHLLPFRFSNAELHRIQHPEKVNFNDPPSYLLDRCYLKNEKSSYRKTVHGVQLFRKLDPNDAYNKCPKFGEMLDEMLALARRCGL